MSICEVCSEPLSEFESCSYGDLCMSCYDKYSRRERIYQDSWKTCNISYLRERLMQEIEEYKESKSTDNLVDIVNFCLMIIERTEEP